MTTIRVSKETAQKLKKSGLSYDKAINSLYALKQPETANTNHNGLSEDAVKTMINKAIMAATFRIKEDITEDFNKALKELKR